MTEEEGAALDIKFQQRFSKNLISNVVYFVLNVIIGLALVPFFLDTLGEAAYALVPLATSVTSYITLVIQSLNMSVSRFLTLDLQRGDITKANETFNTALFGTLVVVLILVPISTLIAWAAPLLFSIGELSAITVFILFLLVFFSALIRAWTSNFMVTLFAHNRLDLWNCVNASYIIVQVIIVVFLFILFGPSLPFIGISYLIAAIFSGILSIYWSKRINPSLKVNPSVFNKSEFREMGVMTGWLIFQELGTLLKLPVALIIVNVLFGAVAETQYSLAMTFITLLIGISSLITNTFRPQVYSYVANRDNVGAAKFISSTIRITGLLMALPLVLICIFAPQLFTLWVGSEYAFLTPLVWILVLPTIITIMDGCMGPLNVACNRVRVTAIANFIAAIINIGLALSLPYIFSIELYGVAIAWVVSLILYGGIFQPIYNAYIINAHPFTFIKPILIGIIFVLVLFVISMIIITAIPVESYIKAAIIGIAISIVYLLILSKIVFSRGEINQIRSCIPRYIENKIPKWLF